jgi:DNA-binding transcriptional regulator YdaS (Cro superfamily)
MKSASLLEARRRAGSDTNLADALGVTSQAVSQWRQAPAARVLEIERLTGVPRHELRPDLYPPAFSKRADSLEAMPMDKAEREARRLFASKLREARLQYGAATGQGELTQRQFALMLEIGGERPEERYRLYEAGKREPPLWILAALRRVTGFSLDDLIAQLPAGRRLDRERSGQREAAE